jgi:hypothetical protein
VFPTDVRTAGLFLYEVSVLCRAGSLTLPTELPTCKTLSNRKCLSDHFNAKIELFAALKQTVLRSSGGVQIPLLYLQSCLPFEPTAFNLLTSQAGKSEKFRGERHECTPSMPELGTKLSMCTPWKNMHPGGLAPLILTSAQHGGQWQASRSGRFTPPPTVPTE